MSRILRHLNIKESKHYGSKFLQVRNNLVIICLYLQPGEVPGISQEPSFIRFTRSRLNLNPEKLHSDGNANKLYVSPVKCIYPHKMV